MTTLPPPVEPNHDDQWVVLIYMATTSPRLRKIMEQDLNEMRARLRLIKGDSIRAWAQLDTIDSTYVIRQPLHARGTHQDEVKAVPIGDDIEATESPKAYFLRKFVDWRFATKDLAQFPNTLLILWGHSQGVAAALSQPGSPAHAMVGRGGFGFDDLSGDSLSLPQIRQAIAKGEGGSTINILSFDSCFMSAAEVTAEFQPTFPAPFRDGELMAKVDYVVASQSAVLLDGLDYGRIADAFVAKDCEARIKPLELGQRLLRQACSGNTSPASLSLLNTGCPTAYDDFQKLLRKLVAELGRVLDTGLEEPTFNSPPQRLRHPRPAGSGARGGGPAFLGANRSEWLRIRDAFEGATWHRVRQFVDLADLCRRLANNSRDEDLRKAALALLAALGLATDGIVLDVRSTHPLILSGVSIYCPWLFPTPEEVRQGAWNAVVDLYEYATELWFNRGPGSWGAFLFHAKHLLEESRQRAINAEVADIRSSIAGLQGPNVPTRLDDRSSYRLSKPPDDLFNSAEPGTPSLDPSEPTRKPHWQQYGGNLTDLDADAAAALDPRVSLPITIFDPDFGGTGK